MSTNIINNDDREDEKQEDKSDFHRFYVFFDAFFASFWRAASTMEMETDRMLFDKRKGDGGRIASS